MGVGGGFSGEDECPKGKSAERFFLLVISISFTPPSISPLSPLLLLTLIPLISSILPLLTPHFDNVALREDSTALLVTSWMVLTDSRNKLIWKKMYFLLYK